MKKLFACLFVLSMAFIYRPVVPVYAQPLDLNARSYILIDSKSGQVLYEQNANEKWYPASTTKILTAALALEKGNLDQIMTASRSAVYDIGKDGMNIGIMPGEEIRMENLLNALLISSANETANIIAENISPTRKDFVDLMNAKALELGAVNTHFANPCGAHEPDHYTTAKDMALIARYAMTFPKIREIVVKRSYTLSPTNKHTRWPVLGTTNKLLYQKSDYFTSVSGIKTGYTGEAGYNLLSSAINKDGMELIAVIFDAKTTDGRNLVFSDAKGLLEYGFKNYSLQKLVNSDEMVKNIQVSDAKGDSSLDLVTSGELSGVLPMDKNVWNVKKIVNIKDSITAPVAQGTVVGSIEYERNGVSLGKVDVVASRTIEATAQSKIINTAKATVFHPTMKKLLLGAAILLLSFPILRFTLRWIFRTLNARRVRS